MNELFICINSVFIHETISCLHLANKFEIYNKHKLVFFFSQLRFMNEKSNKTNYYSNGIVAYGQIEKRNIKSKKKPFMLQCVFISMKIMNVCLYINVRILFRLASIFMTWVYFYILFTYINVK